MQALHSYLDLSREKHDSIRKASQEQSKSIPYMILSRASVSTKLTEHQHHLAQDYLAIQLSIRDRESIMRVFCHSNPDHLTEGVRTLVSAYEPMIRKLHQAVDLSGTITDLEVFLKDMIKLSKIPEPGSKAAKTFQTPTVGDFIQLLHKHQNSSHRFIHQCGKNGPELMSWFHTWLDACAGEFRRKDNTTSSSSTNDAGDLTKPLTQLFTALPQQSQKEILPILTAHASYINALHASSLSRLTSVLASPRTNHPALASTSRPSDANASNPGSRASSRASSPGPGGASSVSASAAAAAAREARPGPGAYLARWQDLVEGTLITPSSAEGKVRKGGSGSVLKASRTDGADAETEKEGQVAEEDEEEDDVFEDAMDKLSVQDEEGGGKGSGKGSGSGKRPDSSVVVEALSKGFREMLGERAKEMA